MSEDLKLPLEVTERETTYRCPFMEIYHRRARFDGFSKDYYVVSFKRRAGVVVVRDGSALLVKQYRFLINGPSWELPGGTMEDAEDLRAGIARECLEETGVAVGQLQELVTYYPGLDNVDNRTTIFYAEDAKPSSSFSGDPREVGQIAWIPLGHCIEMVFSGEILDAMTIAGLLAYHHVRRPGTWRSG